MSVSTWTMRCARMLGEEIMRATGEEVCVELDDGLGLSAMAALTVVPRGPARAVEAHRWARRAQAQGGVVVPIPPDYDDNWINAHAELALAIRAVREAA